FTPAVVAEHYVGNEARFLDRKSCAGDLLSIQYSGLGLSQVMVYVPRRFALRCIHDFSDPRQRAVFPLGKKNKLVTRLNPKITGQMKVLSGGVLVSDEKLHRSSKCISGD